LWVAKGSTSIVVSDPIDNNLLRTPPLLICQTLVATLKIKTVSKLGLFLIMTLLIACGQNNRKNLSSEMSRENFENKRLEYINHPSENDSMCIKDIEKAKRDISKGKIVFCVPMGFGTFHLRQEAQLRQLCNKYNIVFDYELFSDVIITGQTQGCYGAYMDKMITDKFGLDFKQKLLAKADSILIASNDTIEYYLCDKRPQIPGRDDNEITIEATVPIKLSKQLIADKEGDLPFMDIGFYIDKEGNASDYFLNHFYDANNKTNHKFKDELMRIGIKELKAIKRWETGIVNGQKVITENNVRIYF